MYRADILIRELRYAWRGLSKRPLFSILTIASVAVGIAACTAVFTLLDAIVLRPLAVANPEQLVQISSFNRQNRAGYIAPGALDLIEQAGIFESTCAFLTPLSTVEMAGRVRPVASLALSGRCFTVLGVEPAAGRLLEPTDDVAGAANAAVISYDTWRGEFGGDPAAVGQVISIEGASFTIVGVTERPFTGLQVGFPTRLMVPLSPQAFLPVSSRSSRLAANAFARLPPGITLDQANRRLQTLWPDILERSVPAGYQNAQRAAYLEGRVQLTPAATGINSIVRTRFRVPLLALMGIAAVVLVVASLNVANLLLARALERRHEHGIRAALGANHARLAYETSIETVLLLLPSVSAGLWLAYAGVAVLVSAYAGSAGVNFGLDVQPDGRTLGFVAATASIAWLCFALGPIATVGRIAPGTVLASASRSHSAPHGRLRQWLLVLQVAFTVVLVASATWFDATVRDLRAAPLGWDSDGIVAVRVAPLPGRYDESFESSVHYRQLLERITALPGVESAALSNAAPPVAAPYRESVAPVGRADRRRDALALRVSDGFFSTLRLPLVTGSDFDRSDRRSGERTAIISESLARQLFGNEPPVGKHIAVGTRPEDQGMQIVAVASDGTLGDPRAGDPSAVYVNYWQEDSGYQSFPMLLVRSDAPLADVTLRVREEIAHAGREYPLGVSAVVDNLDDAIVQERLLAMTSALFAAIGLLLAAIGLFGMVNVTVVSRTKELGIRIAVGANRRHVIELVLRDTLSSLALGIGAGLLLMWAAARLLTGLMYGAGASSMTAIAITIGVVLATGLAAAWIPARRATRVDPLIALRTD